MFQERKKLEHAISTRTIFKVAIIAVGFILVYVLRNVLIALFIAIVIASALDPIVDRLQKRKFPRWLSVLVILVIVLSLVGLVIFLMIPPVKNQIDQLTNNIPLVLDQFQNINELAIKYNIIDSSQSLLQTIGDRLGGVAEGAFSRISGALGGIITVITIIVLSAYLVAQEKGVKKFVKAISPLKYRPYIMYLTDRVQSKMGQWLRGQLLLMIIVFGLTYFGLWLMGVDYALLLAILAGLLEIIPIIGIPIAIIPALIISFTQSPILALFVLILYVVIQQVENHILVPKIMHKAVGLNPVFVILALLIGYELGGILGVILSVPAATAVAVFVRDFYNFKVDKNKKTINEMVKKTTETSGDERFVA
ncbi:AI-2E family transporter [Patescibacteria group bacterium]